MMKMRYINKIVGLFLLSFTLLVADGGNSGTEIVPKSGTSGAHFLSISPDARFAGMGNAFAAYQNKKASAVFYNPATLVYLDNSDVFFGMVNWFADVKVSSASYAMRMGSDRAIAFHYRGMDTGNMKETTIDLPNGTGNNFSWNSLAVGVSTASRLTEKFSFGVNLYYIKEGSGDYNLESSAWGLDISTFYFTGFNSLKLGMTIRNFGPELDFDDSHVDYSDGIETTDDEDYRQYHIPLTFQIGLSYDFFEDNPQHSLTVNVDGVHPNDSLERLNLGGEYIYMDFLTARFGMYSNHDTASIMGGFGVNLKSFINQDVSFNYSVSNYGLLDYVHQFSIGYGL